MITDGTVILLRRIEVLNQMIQDTPFPDDLAARGSRLPDLHDLLRQECVCVEGIWISSLSYRFLGVHAFTGYEQHIPVW